MNKAHQEREWLCPSTICCFHLTIFNESYAQIRWKFEQKLITYFPACYPTYSFLKLPKGVLGWPVYFECEQPDVLLMLKSQQLHMKVGSGIHKLVEVV